MLSEISDGFELFKQFAFTGFWSLVFVGGLLSAKRYFELDGNWPYYVASVIAFLLLFVPNGWHVVFGIDQRDFVGLMEARQMLPSVSLFEADFWAVLFGSGVGLVISFLLPARRYW